MDLETRMSFEFHINTQRAHQSAGSCFRAKSRNLREERRCSKHYHVRDTVDDAILGVRGTSGDDLTVQNERGLENIP